MMAEPLSNSSNKLSLRVTKRIRLIAAVTMMTAGMLATLDAEAKRMGGGRSLGRQSQTVQREATPPAQQTGRLAPAGTQPGAGAQAQRAQGAPATPAAASARSRWLGPIAGLAAGLGIAALLSHFGLGDAFAGMMANVLVIAALAMLGIWLFRKLASRFARRPALAHEAGAAGVGSFPSPQFRGDHARASESATAAGISAVGGPAARAAFTLPAQFDEEAFLRHAKVNFVRLQAAWDEGNLADIREFTTTEMFAELKVEMDGRGTESHRTDVVQLHAELLSVEEGAAEHRASVRFSGLIRESANGPAEPFAEIWNLSKPARAGGGWLLAGIEQLAAH